jgi:hypothetical protein
MEAPELKARAVDYPSLNVKTFSPGKKSEHHP